MKIILHYKSIKYNKKIIQINKIMKNLQILQYQWNY